MINEQIKNMLINLAWALGITWKKCYTCDGSGYFLGACDNWTMCYVCRGVGGEFEREE